jgi:hypothetical protein
MGTSDKKVSYSAIISIRHVLAMFIAVKVKYPAVIV